METGSTLNNEMSIEVKMDVEKKQLMYKIIFGICSIAAIVGIPYLFYVAAVHWF